MAESSAGNWREDAVLIPWLVMAGFLVLGAMGFFFVAWLARGAARWVMAIASWTQEGR